MFVTNLSLKKSFADVLAKCFIRHFCLMTTEEFSQMLAKFFLSQVGNLVSDNLPANTKATENQLSTSIQ